MSPFESTESTGSMKNIKKWLTLFLMLTVLLAVAALVRGQSPVVDEASNAVHDAYNAILKADSAGANVTELTNQLDLALNYTSQAQVLLSSDQQEAQQLALQAQALAQAVTEQASTAKAEGLLGQPLAVAFIVVALLSSGFAVYFWGPALFWKAWLQLRKNYHVKTTRASTLNTGLFLTGEQICAVILGLTIIIAFFAASPFFLPKNSGEQFSELGILGPNMKLGDYPSQVVAGDPFSLNVYVGNQMDKPMYYEVLVKLGTNESAVDPAPNAPLQQFAKILPKNGTWIFPVNFTLTQVGENQRLLFELWVYNETINQNQYHDRWGQIWLNVTAPAA